MTSAANDVKYTLIIQDDFLGYSWIYSSPSTAAKQAKHALMNWSARSWRQMDLSPTVWRTFKSHNTYLGQSAPYAPTLYNPLLPVDQWPARDTRQKKLRIARVFPSNLKINTVEWLDLVSIIQSAIDNAPSLARRSIVPIIVCTCFNLPPPIFTVTASSFGIPITLTQAQVKRTVKTTTVIIFMEALHSLVQLLIQQYRQNERYTQRQNELAHSDTSDCVLVARNDFYRGENYAYGVVVGAAPSNLSMATSISSRIYSTRHLLRYTAPSLNFTTTFFWTTRW